MKVPTKGDLYDWIEALERENTKLAKKLEEEERKRWLENKERAAIAFYNLIPFPSSRVVNVALDHIDKAGFWFTFELDNDKCRQTFAVRHTDLQTV